MSIKEKYNPGEDLWQKRLYNALQAEINKTDLDYAASMYTDSNGNRCVAITGKGDDSEADYLSGYIVRTDDAAVLKYDYFENPDQEIPLRYNSIGMAEVAHELFKRVEPLVDKYEKHLPEFFTDPSNSPEFDDPYYNWDGNELEYDYHEDEYDALCRDDEKHISEVIASNLKDREFDVNASYDIDEDKIKYQVDISFYFDEVPSKEEQNRLGALVETALDGCDIEWEDTDEEVYLLNKSGEMIGRLDSNIKLSNPPEDQDVACYSFDVTWYAYDTAKYKEPPERDYAGNDYD